MKHFRMVVGLAFWCGIVALLCGALAGRGGTAQATGRRCLSDLCGYYTSSRRLELRLPPSCELSEGDPVLAADAKGLLRQVGIVVSLSGDGESPRADAVLFSSAPELGRPVRAYYLSTPDSIDWAVQILLPRDRRRQIEDELTAAFQEHRREILEALQPVIRKSVHDALAVLEQDLPRAVENHRPELEALAAKYHEEVLKKELVPLVRAEVWPIARRDSEPTVRQVSAELWQRVSLWRFAWRGVLDRMPLVRGSNRVGDELQRFLDEEAVPIFDRHEGEFQDVIEKVVADVADNRKVQAAFKRNFDRVSHDPELRRVLTRILREAVVQNPRFWAAVRQNLTSPAAQDAWQLAGSRLEPTMRRIGDLVLGTREGGLTQEFTQVLRQQILLKDRNGIVVGSLPRSGPALPCTPLEAWFSDTRATQP